MSDQRSCLEVAIERLENRAIRDSTYRNYLNTLKALEIEDVPFSSLTVRSVNQKLLTIMTESTRKKHATNIRAMFGIHVAVPRVKQKKYDLPTVEEVHEAFAESPYRIHAFSMLYAGMRIGESVVKQPINGNVITIDRQRTPQNLILPPKSAGPVVVPAWFAKEYRETEEFNRHHATIYTGIRRRGLKMLGIKMNPHMLRHLFATNLVEMGASPRVLQAQMRHGNVRISLEYYVHTRQQDIESLMNRFNKSQE